MRKHFMVLFFVAIFLMLGKSAHAATILVSGSVTANNNDVTAGWVELFGNDKYAGAEISNGTYEIDQPENQNWTTGSYTLRVIPDTEAYPQYAQTSQELAITPGTPVTQDVSLNAAVKQILVTVTDENDQPVNNLGVYAKASGGGGGMSFFSPTDNGQATFTVRAEGAPYYITVENCIQDNDGASQCAPWTYTGDTTKVSFTEADGVSETQQVTVKGETPSSTVIGHITYENEGFSGFIHLYNDKHLFSGWMDDNGDFTVYALPGLYKIDLLPKQSQTNPDVVRYYIDDTAINGAIQVGEGTTDVGDLAASYKNSTLHAFVQDQDGNPLEGVVANFWLAGGGEWRKVTLMPGSQGSGGSEAHAGIYFVNAIDPTGEYFSAPAQMVNVEENEEPQVTLTMLQSNATVNFVVENPDGSRAATYNSFIHCWDATNNRGNGTDITRGAGTLLLVDGTYLCTSATPKNANYSLAPQEITVNADDSLDTTLTLMAHDASVSGMLLDQQNTVVTPSDTEEKPLQVILEGETYGRFEIEVNDDGTWSADLPADTYKISIDGEEVISVIGEVQQTLTVESGEEKTDADITTYAADTTLNTTVYQPDGTTPLSFVTVTCSYLPEGQKGDFDGGNMIEVTGETDENGVVSIPALEKQGDVTLEYSCGVAIPDGEDYIAPGSEKVTPGENTDFVVYAPDTTLNVSYESTGAPQDVQCQAWATDGIAMVTATDDDGDGALSMEVSSKAGEIWDVSCSGSDGDQLFTPTQSEEISVKQAGDYDATLNLQASDIALPEGASETFDPTAEKTMNVDSVQLQIPSNAIPSSDDVTLTVTPAPNDIAKNEENMNLAVPLNLQAFDASGNIKTSFTQPITVTLPYDEEVVNDTGVLETDLVPKYYDASGGTWQIIPGYHLDTDANTITFDTDHFTEFAVLYNARIAGSAPKKVKNVHVVKKKLHTDSAKITWKQLRAADHYQLLLSTRKGAKIKRFDNIVKHSYTITRKFLDPGKRYLVRVRAVGDNGLFGQWSRTLKFTTKSQ